MKLTEYKNEDALDLLADLIEPASEIMSDPKIKEMMGKDAKTKVAKIVQHILKNHKKSIIAILARLDNTPVKEYKCDIFTLPIKILELLNDKDLIDFFSSQELMEDQKLFGSVTETIGAENQ